jgi:MFS family permease
VVAFIFYAIGMSYWWLVAGAVLEGLSRAFYSGNNDAFLHDTLADDGLESEYEDHLGKSNSAEQLALGLSALAGGIIASFSFNYLLWLSVISQACMLYVSYLFIEPKSRKKLDTNVFSHLREATKIFVTNRKLRLLSITSIINFSFSEMIYQFRAAFISMVWPIWAIGFANVLSNFGATWSFYYSGRLIKKFDSVNILLFRSVWNKFASILSYSISNVFSPLILATNSLLFGVGSVAENKLMQQEFSDHQRSTMASLNSLFGNISFAIMSVVLGKLADVTSPSRALLILNFISLPIIYLYYLLFKNDRRIKS